MRHEIRMSGGPQCAACGSYELIYTAPHHQALVRQVRIQLDAPWYRPLKRRWGRQVTARLEREMEDFLARTRHEIVESPNSVTRGGADPVPA